MSKFNWKGFLLGLTISLSIFNCLEPNTIYSVIITIAILILSGFMVNDDD